MEEYKQNEGKQCREYVNSSAIDFIDKTAGVSHLDVKYHKLTASNRFYYLFNFLHGRWRRSRHVDNEGT